MNPAHIKIAMEGLYFSGLHWLLRPVTSGVGAILTMHRVCEGRPDVFQPNRLLEITPAFLGDIIEHVASSDVEFVSLDEAHRRLVEQDFRQRFVAVTFDDGYRDVRDLAYPILARHRVPFTVFVPSQFAAGEGELWWVALETIVARASEIRIPDEDGRMSVVPCATDREKHAAYRALHDRVYALDSYAAFLDFMRRLAAAHEIDLKQFCAPLCMGWAELEELARDPLVTIGAHTTSHAMLSKVTAGELEAEIATGRAELERRLGRPVTHFAYPYGGHRAAGPREFALAAAAGFATAVTTRPGVLFRNHGRRLTALPRLSLNGLFQRRRYVDVLLSGVGTAMLNGTRLSGKEAGDDEAGGRVASLGG